MDAGKVGRLARENLRGFALHAYREEVIAIYRRNHQEKSHAAGCPGAFDAVLGALAAECATVFARVYRLQESANRSKRK